MIPLLDLVTLVVVAWFGSRLVLAFRWSLRPVSRARSLEIARGIRLRHVAPVPLVLAVVAGAGALLVQVPGLSFGWWTAIGGHGNPAFGLTETTEGTPLGTIIPLVFITLLIPALPLLVEREERLFRLGAEEWPFAKQAAKALLFGLIHAVIGIPIGVAIALSLGGAWFTFVYLRGWRRGGRTEGLLESTRSHLAYNAVIIVVVFAVLVVDAVLMALD